MPITTDTPGLPTFISARLHLVYFIIAMVAGIGFALIVPPNGAPDEISHTSKAARVAFGNAFGVKDVPTPDIYAWYGPINDGRMFANPKFTREEVNDVLRKPLACETRVRSLHNGVASYSPLLYVVPAAVMRAGCNGMRFGTFLHVSRILNLLCSSLLISLAIYWGGAGRWPIFAVGLLPPFLYQTASVSGDSLFLGAVMLLIGVTVGAAGKLISSRRFAALAALVALSAFTKPGYAWLGLLPLVLYADFLRSGWNRWQIGATFLLLPVLFHALLLYLGRGSTPVVPGIDPSANLQFLLHHPWSFFVALGKVPSVYPIGHQWNVFMSLLGKVGWLSISPGPLSYVVSAAILIASLCLRERALSKGMRACIFILAAASCIMIALPLYIYASGPNPEAISGLQGRYFFPTLALFLVAVSFTTLATIRRVGSYAVVIASVAVVGWSLLVTRGFYYG